MAVPVPVITETINRKTRSEVARAIFRCTATHDAMQARANNNIAFFFCRGAGFSIKALHKYEKESSESTMRVNGHSEQSARQEMGKTALSTTAALS